MDKIIQEYEDQLACTRGKILTNVRYFEIKYESGEPAWDCDKFHSLDYGVELEMNDGVVYSLIWDQKNGEDWIKYVIGPLEGEFKDINDVAQWNVTNNSYWQNVVNKPVVNSRVIWLSDNNITWPKCILLEFEGKQTVYIVHGQYSENGKDCVGGDQLSIFFNDNILGL